MSRGNQRHPAKQASELEVLKKVDEMITYAYSAVRHFPRAEKPVLSAEIRRTCWELMRLVIACNKRYHKKTTMQQLDAELEILRRMVRKAMELGFLPFRHYENWARMNDEIGRLIGGWIKSQRVAEQQRGGR